MKRCSCWAHSSGCLYHVYTTKLLQVFFYVYGLFSIKYYILFLRGSCFENIAQLLINLASSKRFRFTSSE